MKYWQSLKCKLLKDVIKFREYTILNRNNMNKFYIIKLNFSNLKK